MKNVLCNKVTTLKVGDEFISYAGLCIMILERIPANGVTVKEMKLDYELTNKLMNVKEDEKITLLNEEVKRLKELLDLAKFPFRNRAFVEFGDEIDRMYNELNN